MSHLDLPQLLAFAGELADVADGISMDRFGGALPATSKADGTPVTDADRRIETAMRDRITAAWPGHAVLGEEGGGRLDPDVPTWVVDPIDATKNFMRGVPVFATLIALVHAGVSVVGVASAPALGERWDAYRGAGARRNGVPVGVSEIGELSQSHVLHGGLDWYRRSEALWELLGGIADDAWRTRGFGDFWMHLLVAGGMAEVAFERDLSIWDVAALECIVTEAGGRMTSWSGGSVLTGGDAVTTNGLLHQTMIARLAPVGD